MSEDKSNKTLPFQFHLTVPVPGTGSLWKGAGPGWNYGPPLSQGTPIEKTIKDNGDHVLGKGDKIAVDPDHPESSKYVGVERYFRANYSASESPAARFQRRFGIDLSQNKLRGFKRVSKDFRDFVAAEEKKWRAQHPPRQDGCEFGTSDALLDCRGGGVSIQLFPMTRIGPGDAFPILGGSFGEGPIAPRRKEEKP